MHWLYWMLNTRLNKHLYYELGNIQMQYSSTLLIIFCFFHLMHERQLSLVVILACLLQYKARGCAWEHEHTLAVSPCCMVPGDFTFVYGTRSQSQQGMLCSRLSTSFRQSAAYIEVDARARQCKWSRKWQPGASSVSKAERELPLSSGSVSKTSGGACEPLQVNEHVFGAGVMSGGLICSDVAERREGLHRWTLPERRVLWGRGRSEGGAGLHHLANLGERFLRRPLGVNLQTETNWLRRDLSEVINVYTRAGGQ